jgi:molybdopterin converting factor small subunit
MPTVTVKISGWLTENLDPSWTHPDGLSVPTGEGETILGMVRQLAAESDVFRKIVFPKDYLEFGADVLVILNGVFVNPYDRSETLLRDGDEVMLLPVVDGG